MANNKAADVDMNAVNRMSEYREIRTKYATNSYHTGWERAFGKQCLADGCDSKRHAPGTDCFGCSRHCSCDGITHESA